MYGVENMYLANEEQQKHVTALTGKKTISFADMNHITWLTDMEFEEVIAPSK